MFVSLFGHSQPLLKQYSAGKYGPVDHAGMMVLHGVSAVATIPKIALEVLGKGMTLILGGPATLFIVTGLGMLPDGGYEALCMIGTALKWPVFISTLIGIGAASTLFFAPSLLATQTLSVAVGTSIGISAGGLWAIATVYHLIMPNYLSSVKDLHRHLLWIQNPQLAAKADLRDQRIQRWKDFFTISIPLEWLIPD